MAGFGGGNGFGGGFDPSVWGDALSKTGAGGGGKGVNLGAAIGKATGDFKGAYWDTQGAGMFGDRDDVGVMGTGQFKAKPYEIDPNAFQNPQSAALQASFAKQLAASQGRQVPQVGAAQIIQGPQSGARADQMALAGQMQQQALGLGPSTPQDAFRNQQMGLMQALQQQAAGQGPSLAENQLRAGMDRSLKQQAGLAASLGGNSALARRNLAMGAAQANRGLSMDAANARMAEQQQARGQLADLAAQGRQQDLGREQGARELQANLLTQGRQQDIGLATDQAQLTQQARLGNQNATLQGRQLDDGQSKFFNQAMMQQSEANRDAAMGMQQLGVQNYASNTKVNADAYASAGQNRGGVIGGIGGAIAGAATMMSDEEQKTDIVPAAPTPTATALAPKKKTTLESIAEGLRDMSKSTSSSSSTGHEKMGDAIGKMMAMGMSSSSSSSSDRRAKTDVGAGDDKAKGFLDAIQGYSFRYKDPRNGEGPQLGVMAQDLEKTDFGKGMVIDTPEGKMVDSRKVAAAALAGASSLNKRLGDLEAALRSAKKRSA